MKAAMSVAPKVALKVAWLVVQWVDVRVVQMVGSKAAEMAAV